MKDLIIPIITAFAAGYSTYFFNRRKSRADAQKVELDIIQAWRGIADDLRAEVVQLTEKCHVLAAEVESFRKENAQLKAELKRFERKLDSKV